MSGKVEIKPTIISDLAKNIQSSAINCETILGDIVAIMGRLAPNSGAWSGNDANKLNGSFNNFKKSFTAFKEILEERSKSLIGVAQQYLEADATLEKKAPEVEVKTATTAKTEVAIAEKEIVEEPVKKVEEPKTNNTSKSYRMTYYYPSESSSYTGSGLSTKNFQINNKGWYTYKGKIVVAAATEELLNSREYSYDTKMHTRVPGRHYYRYYDELTVNVDGVDYPAIVLDSCGASMKLNEDRIDLFVSNAKSGCDRLSVTVTNK